MLWYQPLEPNKCNRNCRSLGRHNRRLPQVIQGAHKVRMDDLCWNEKDTAIRLVPYFERHRTMDFGDGWADTLSDVHDMTDSLPRPTTNRHHVSRCSRGPPAIPGSYETDKAPSRSHLLNHFHIAHSPSAEYQRRWKKENYVCFD